jgi:hypothetical protein
MLYVLIANCYAYSLSKKDLAAKVLLGIKKKVLFLRRIFIFI